MEALHGRIIWRSYTDSHAYVWDWHMNAIRSDHEELPSILDVHTGYELKAPSVTRQLNSYTNQIWSGWVWWLSC
jgi:hypothetical protein